MRGLQKCPHSGSRLESPYLAPGDDLAFKTRQQGSCPRGSGPKIHRQNRDGRSASGCPCLKRLLQQGFRCPVATKEALVDGAKGPLRRGMTLAHGTLAAGVDVLAKAQVAAARGHAVLLV